MATVNELPPKTSQETYVAFSKLKESFGSEEFNFVLFYGNPTDTEISWCPDCRSIHVDFVRFAEEYRGAARFHTVPVGSRKEFNGDSPFVKAVPHLEAVPTLVVYGKHIAYLKMVDPTFEDIVYFVKKHDL